MLLHKLPRPKKWLELEIKTPAHLVDVLAGYLAEIEVEGLSQQFPVGKENNFEPKEIQTVTAYLPDDEQAQAKIDSLKQYLNKISKCSEMVDLSVMAIEDRDWGEEWKRFFQPFRVGRRLVIRPSWESFEAQGDDLVITLDPGMAFGTGHHDTTRLCLEALETILDNLRGRQENIRLLDVGTGTGILAIAAAKLGAKQVTAIDIDDLALEAARHNAHLNNLADITFLAKPLSSLSASFDLIVANITSSVLIEMRPHFLRLLAERGQLVISGILDRERRQIETQFLFSPFDRYRLITGGEWLCFICRRGS